MTKLQLIVVSSAVVLFGILYFGFDTKPREHAKIEQNRAQNAESTNVSSLIMEARDELRPEASATLLALERQLKQVEADSLKVGIYQQISSTWYAEGHPAIAGFYAEQLAEIVDTEEAWSIAGTTYSIGLNNTTEDKLRTYCFGRAVKAFENAISINPLNVDHKINLALCYIEVPPAGNPMKGILMLRELNEKYPENVPVLNNLGRLAIQTGQFERAITRLLKAVELDAENLAANCLLAQAYEGLGKTAEASVYKDKCEGLRAPQ